MPRPVTHERFLRALVAAGVVVAVFAGWVGTGLGGDTVVRWVDDVGTLAAALAAAVLCARSARRRSGRLRAFWWLLAGACAAWTVGEGVWGLYEVVLGRDVPSVSWADIGYLAAIPPTAAALLVHPAMRGRAVGKARSMLDGLVIAAAFFFLSWTFLLEPLRRMSDLGSLGGAVTLAYPVGDVVILVLVVLLIRGTTTGSRLDLWCLLAGLLAITLSDSMYGYLAQVKDYASGNVVDVGWFAGYLGLALGAYGARAAVTSRRPTEAPSLSSAAVIVPFLPLFAALGVAAVEIELGHHLDPVALATAFALVVLVLIRQVLLAVDLWASGRDEDAPVADRLVAALGRALPDDSSESSPSAP